MRNSPMNTTTFPSNMGAWTAIGAGIGAALGVAMNNMGVGLPTGIAIGLAIGAAQPWTRWRGGKEKS
jgi:hypothetical protein